MGAVFSAVSVSNRGESPAGDDNHHRDQMMWMQWAVMVFGLCLAVISATMQAVQSTAPLSLSSQFVYAGLVIFSSAVVVAIYIRPDHPRASMAVMHLSIFSGTTALMLALVINLSIGLMVMCVAIYFIGLLTIIIIKLLKSDVFISFAICKTPV